MWQSVGIFAKQCLIIAIKNDEIAIKSIDSLPQKAPMSQALTALWPHTTTQQQRHIYIYNKSFGCLSHSTNQFYISHTQHFFDWQLFPFCPMWKFSLDVDVLVVSLWIFISFFCLRCANEKAPFIKTIQIKTFTCNLNHSTIKLFFFSLSSIKFLFNILLLYFITCISFFSSMFYRSVCC